MMVYDDDGDETSHGCQHIFNMQFDVCFKLHTRKRKYKRKRKQANYNNIEKTAIKRKKQKKERLCKCIQYWIHTHTHARAKQAQIERKVCRYVSVCVCVCLCVECNISYGSINREWWFIAKRPKTSTSSTSLLWESSEKRIIHNNCLTWRKHTHIRTTHKCVSWALIVMWIHAYSMCWMICVFVVIFSNISFFARELVCFALLCFAFLFIHFSIYCKYLYMYITTY